MTDYSKFQKLQEERETKLNAMYEAEPWGKLARQAGFNPYHTEGSARSAFAFCAKLLSAAEARIAELEAKVREAEAQSPASMVTAIQSALDRAHGAEARVPAAYKAGMLAAAEIADRLSREHGSDYGCDLVADAARAEAAEPPPEEWR